MGGKSTNKTRATGSSVESFLAGFTQETQADCRVLMELMRGATGCHPVMWGAHMVGYGNHHYRYPSGREGEIFQVGFSPRKAALSVYLTCDLDSMGDLLGKLGPHERGKGCLYLKRLEGVCLVTLKQMIERGVKACT